MVSMVSGSSLDSVGPSKILGSATERVGIMMRNTQRRTAKTK